MVNVAELTHKAGSSYFRQNVSYMSESQRTFEKVNFSRSEARGSQFDRCKFIECNFDSANFENSVFTNCEFDFRALEGIKTGRFAGCEFRNCKFFSQGVIALPFFNLEDTRFVDCDFANLNFRATTLRGTLFEGCSFADLNLTSCIGNGCFFKQCTAEYVAVSLQAIATMVGLRELSQRAILTLYAIESEEYEKVAEGFDEVQRVVQDFLNREDLNLPLSFRLNLSRLLPRNS